MQGEEGHHDGTGNIIHNTPDLNWEALENELRLEIHLPTE